MILTKPMTKTLYVRLTPAMFKSLETIARKNQVTVSVLVRRLLWKKLGVKDE